MKGKNRVGILALVLVCALLSGCTPVVNEVTTTTPVGTTTVTEAGITTTAASVTDKEQDTTVTKLSTTETRTTRPPLTTQTLNPSTHPPYVTVTLGSQREYALWETIELTPGTTPLEQGLAFGGGEFSYAHRGTAWDADASARFSEFETLYHANLNIRGIPEGEYVAALSAAMVAGDPYDIIHFSGNDHSGQITSNVMRPLEGYVTTADLWDASAPEKGGFSRSLMQTLSLNGHIYGVGGVYEMSPTVLFYNKDLFAAAGYTGSKDPLALYNVGQWTWEALYKMLSDIQKPDDGLWGIHSIAAHGAQQLIVSYDTDLIKRTNDGRVVQNLADPQLYTAMTTLQTYCYGDGKVADPDSRSESVYEDLLNGNVASAVGSAEAYETVSAQQGMNVGVVPVPGANRVRSVWEWSGYGAGNGSTNEAALCALAFAKYNARNKPSYYEAMEATAGDALCRALESDKLRAPMTGFYSSAGKLSDTASAIVERIGVKGEHITVTLKAYEKVVQTLVDAALKN